MDNKKQRLGQIASRLADIDSILRKIELRVEQRPFADEVFLWWLHSTYKAEREELYEEADALMEPRVHWLWTVVATATMSLLFWLAVFTLFAK